MQNTNTKKTISEKELEVLKFWNENKIFEKSVALPAGAPPVASFSFYDGPPFATGLPHNGHILAGTIKDAIPRYHTMQGKTVRRVWGWDCHGLPIENLIEKELNLNSKKEIEELGIEKFNKAAADSVLRYESEWKKIVPRLGRWVDMENSYKTMDWTYTESVWWAWKSLYKKGLAYEGYKIMHICPRCETPLAQSEVGLEYNDITDMTVTAKFELEEKDENDNIVTVLAWTTTPWTLPGNTALAVNKNLEYVKVCIQESLKKINIENNNEVETSELVEVKNNYYIVAKKLSEKVFANLGADKKIISEEGIDINKVIGQKYKPVFDTYNNEEYLNNLENSENIWRVWHADFITDESGTGIAHEAPAFGAEDYNLAKENKIPIIKHINMNGSFAAEVEKSVPAFAGLVVKKKDDSMSTDIEVVKWLAHNSKLFSKEKIVHSYPLCWRCKTPLLNYATSSWFVDVPKIKDKLISENQKVSWVPEHVRDGRFGKWLEGAREWAVSRKRYWGAPLPIWRSVDGVETKVIGSLAEIATPAKNKYYVMRHGEANSNVENRFDAGEDVTNHLTEKGREQVKISAQELKNLGVDIIIHSPVLRAKETKDIVLSSLDFNLNFKNSKNIFEEYDLRESDEHPTTGAKIETQKRVQKVLQKYEESYTGKNILIITHMGPARAMYIQNLEHNVNLKNAEMREVKVVDLPRDETGAINLHKPYIDNVILKDSRGVDMKIIGDVFDCWFESGSMPYAQLHYPFENVDTFEKNFPADFIAEGMDQTRGWFYSLINLGVGLFDKSPFKNVIVNGTVMAADGRKMSKSEKNYTDPMLLVEKYGADALRFSLANSPVMQGENVLFSDTLVEESYKKVISKIENVLDFYNLHKDEKDVKVCEGNSTENKSLYTQSVENIENKNILDQWIVVRAQEVVNSSVDGYESYKLDRAVSDITLFVDDFSTWYLRRSRDRLKEGDEQALATMKFIFISFAKCIAPMMPFLAERIYRNVLEKEISQNENQNISESVHLTKYPEKNILSEGQKNILLEMKSCREICSEALMLRQKINIPVRQVLAGLTINKSIENSNYLEIIKEEVNVKSVIIKTELAICELDTNITPELKREGDQRELSRRVKDMRKELNLTPADFITLTVTQEKLDLVDENYQKEMKIKEVKIGELFLVEKYLS